MRCWPAWRRDEREPRTDISQVDLQLHGLRDALRRGLHQLRRQDRRANPRVRSRTDRRRAVLGCLPRGDRAVLFHAARALARADHAMSAAVVVLSAASSPPDFRQHLDAFLSLALYVLRNCRHDEAPNYESGGQEFESLRARQIRRKIKSLMRTAETDQHAPDLCPSHARKCSRTRLRCGASRPPGIFYTSMTIGTPIWVATGV